MIWKNGNIEKKGNMKKRQQMHYLENYVENCNNTSNRNIDNKNWAI